MQLLQHRSDTGGVSESLCLPTLQSFDGLLPLNHICSGVGVPYFCWRFNIYQQGTCKTREFKSKKIYIFQHISFYEQFKSFNKFDVAAEGIFLSGFRYTRHFLVFVRRREQEKAEGGSLYCNSMKMRIIFERKSVW